MIRVLGACALLLASSASASDDLRALCSTRLHIENDVAPVVGSDRHYTNGLRLDSLGCGPVTGWNQAMRAMGTLVSPLDKEVVVSTGFTIGSNIYTPRGTEASGVDPGERPFAGWLYLGLLGSAWSGRDRYDLELDLGATGPAALAKDIQGEWHKLLDIPEFRSWDRQIAFSPVVRLSVGAENELLQWPVDRSGLDLKARRYFTLSLRSRAEVGNVLDTASVGPMFRAGVIRDGSSLGDNMASLGQKNERALFWEAFFFARGNVKLVLFNAFLSGAPFTDSVYTTSAEPWVLEGDAGVAFSVGPFSLGGSVVVRSTEMRARHWRWDEHVFTQLQIAYVPERYRR